MNTQHKSTSNIEPISFAFELYQRIPRSRSITAKELQSELSHIGIERDIRTIQRNLNTVVQYLDVDQDVRSKPYGYRRRLSAPVVLNPKEWMVVQLARAMLIEILPASMHSIPC